MINLTSLAIVLALGIGWAYPSVGIDQTPTAQSSQTKPIRKVPGATVSGRVTTQGKGKAGIVVGIRASDFGPQVAPAYKGTTDADGNYRVADIPPGNYQVMPIAPAYVIAEAGAFGNPGKTLILAEGERVDGIDFSIVKGGVVTGKVTQSDGKPVIEERVYLVLADQPTSRVGAFGLSFQTDDRGVYRMFGLRPGRYKVCIGLAEDSAGFNRPRQIYQRVFYPGVREAEEAKVVEVGEGTEATNVDITVGQSIQGFTASGTIVDGETSVPLPNIRFGVQRFLDGNNPPFSPFSGINASSNSRGEFRLENITPGKYAVFVVPQLNSEIRVEPVRFEIVDQDVTGLMLKTSKGAVLTGAVVVEGTRDPAVYEKLSKLRLFVFVRGGESSISSGFGQTSTIAADGSFRLAGLQAGSANFQLAPQAFQEQTGFVILRIEREGVAQPRGLEIKAGEEISGLKIIVVYGNGTVRGTVKWDGGPPPDGSRLLARITRDTKDGDNTTAIRPQEVDARGHFVFQGIPSGSYEITVNAFVPQARSRQVTARQTVSVSDGVVTEVELVIDTTAPTNP